MQKINVYKENIHYTERLNHLMPSSSQLNHLPFHNCSILRIFLKDYHDLSDGGLITGSMFCRSKLLLYSS